MSFGPGTPGADVLGRVFEVEESWLSVVVRAGPLRCVLEARAVARLDPYMAADTPAGETADVVSLAALLEIDDSDTRPQVAIRLKDRPTALLVQAVESVVDLRSARFSRLPVLTRLSRPVFHGVYDVEGDLLPALDLEVLLPEAGDGRG